MLRAAIVGLGSWGQVLVDAVQTNGDPKGDLIRFDRAVTRTPDRAKDFANRQGLILTDRLEDALGDDIDAVVLASINSVHVDQIVAAANAGKPVFVEKPLAFSLSEAQRQRILEIADRCPVHRTLMSDMSIESQIRQSES